MLPFMTKKKKLSRNLELTLGKIRIRKELGEEITLSKDIRICEKETQSHPVFILLSIRWNRKNPGQAFKILLIYLF